MSVLFANVQFRAFDYDGFRLSLFELARADFDEWTDTLESNEGVMFVEWLAFIGAAVVFQQNFLSRQCFVPTVTEAKNVIKLAKQYDYDIPDNTAAVVDLKISNEDGTPFTFDVIIPEGTQCRTTGAEPLIFETTEDLTIPAGNVFGSVPAAHQETKVETDIADGSADFETAMTYGPYIEDSMVVEVDATTWAQVDNFLDSTGTSEHFRVEVDSNQIPKVTFGDGVLGKIPAASSQVTYTYKVGGGTDGNVPPATITEIPGTFYDVNNNPVDLEVTNLAAADGGEDREEISVTKLRMPASLSAKEISINKSDFKTNIQSVAGVSRVAVQTVNDDPNIPENTVLCVILPSSSDTVSAGLEASILQALEDNPGPLTQRIWIVDPAFVTIALDIRDLVFDASLEDGSGAFASATITIANNTFDGGDKVTVNGVDFTQGVDWTPGGTPTDSATALAAAIDGSANPLLQDISATSLGAVVTVQARTMGEHGNAYTLTESDGATNNFTLSGATFANGEDTAGQAAIREAVVAFFGRTNVDANGEYTVDFGLTVFRNTLIWLIKDVLGVESFDLVTPADDTPLAINEFPKYTLKFTTS